MVYSVFDGSSVRSTRHLFIFLGLILSLHCSVQAQSNEYLFYFKNCETDPKKPTTIKISGSVRIYPLSHFYVNITTKFYDEVRRYKWDYSMAQVASFSAEDQRNKTYLNVQHLIKPFSSVENPWKYIYIPKYSLGPGHYIVYPTGSPAEKDAPKLHFKEKECFIIIQGSTPVALIKGASTTVKEKTEIHLDATESYFDDNGTNTTNNLHYKWSCKQKLQPPTLCKESPISTKAEWNIPGQYVRANDEIKVELEVITPYEMVAKSEKTIFVEEMETTTTPQPSTTTTLTTTILSHKSISDLDITCENNCPPNTNIPNFRSSTFLRVSCRRNCNGLNEKDYEWTIALQNGKPFNFDYNKNTRFGRVGEKFIIEKNALNPGEYVVSVKLKDSAKFQGESKIYLNYASPPRIDSCTTEPSNGVSLETLFILRCNGVDVGKNYLYEVHVREEHNLNEEDIVSNGYPPNIFQNPFLLPKSEGYVFIVRIDPHPGPYAEVELKTEVRSFLADKPSREVLRKLKQMYDEGTNSISNMISSKDKREKEMAVKMFQSLVNELVSDNSDDEELKKFVNDLKYKALEDMSKASISSFNDILQVGEAITKLVTYQEPDKPDPLLTKYTSQTCKKLSEQQLELVQKETFPVSLQEKSSKITNMLHRCLEANTNPNSDIFGPVHHITSEAPGHGTGDGVTENYADYSDYGDDFLEDMDNLKEASRNIINATATAAKVTAMTTAVGEGLITNIGKRVTTIVAKDKGKKLVNITINSRGTTLIPSDDWVGSEHPFDILFSTWNHNLLWWDPKHLRVATAVSSIQFWHSSCKERVQQFKKPVNLFFHIKNVTTFKTNFYKNTFTVPKNYIRLTDEELNHHIDVYRVTLQSRLAMHVLFYNISSTDAFDVVLTKFRFPTITDFKKSNKTVTSDSNLNFVRANDEDYHIWYYVGILANRNAVAKNNLKVLSYEQSFTLTCCVRWYQSDNLWKAACKPGRKTNQSHIHCQCWNMSVFAGYRQNLLPVPQEVTLPEIELEIQSRRIIFTTTAIILGIYCLLILFVLRDKKREIFYLADNNRTHRFVYLLVVKTKGRLHSGTTSNVTIKLVGKKNSSDPHLLNYPDPKMRLLQEYGEDMFALATEYHLGELLYIELWNDSWGQNPAWFCDSIKVYDMQEDKEWFFKVKQRLCVRKGEHYLKVKPIPQIDTFLIKLRRFRIYLHNWWFFQNEEHFCLLKKSTVLLSKLLMICSIVMAVYGVPKLQLQDAFDLTKYKVTSWTVFLAFLCSFPSSLFHVGIAWTFRYSERQIVKQRQNKFPFGVTLTCWSLLIGLIVASLTFLVFFGFWVPLHISWIWLTTCAIGVGLDIFVYEIVFVYSQNFICNLRILFNVKEKFEDILKVIEKQRKILYEKYGDMLLRPYFQHLYKPLTKYQIRERLRTISRRREVIAELEDLVMFGIYVIILYVVILVDKDHLVVRNKENILDMMEGDHTRSLDFYAMESIEDVYSYINHTIIPTVQPTHWYGRYVIADAALMLDVVNKFVGVVRIRQHRIKPNICEIIEEMQFLKMNCWPEFVMVHAETDTFASGWRPYESFMEFDRLKSMWEYSGVDKTGSLVTIGEYSAYSGGGYVVFLGRTLYNSYVNFHRIVETFWLDEHTRIVFIEFLTYNADYNLFSAIRIMVEESVSGGTFKNIDVATVRMIFVENELRRVTYVMFCLFASWVAILFLKLSVGLVKHFRALWKSVWFIIDITIIIISILCICVYTVRAKMVGNYLVELETQKHNEFLPYFYLFYIEDFISCIAALLLCIATVRLWKFLRFGRMFRILERTLSLSAGPLLSVAFGFCIILIGFSMTIVLIYGNEFEKIDTISRTMRLLVTLCLKASELSLSSYIKYRTAFILFTLYAIAITIVMYLFITIVVLNYITAQKEFSSDVDDYNIGRYIQERVLYFPKFVKYKCGRLRGGQVEKNKVEPKSDKFLYYNSSSIPTHRMKAMECITQCVVRNLRRSSDTQDVTGYDLNLMFGICRHFYTDYGDYEDVDVFFKGKVKGKRIKMIDEKRITKIANVVNLLLMEEFEIVPLPKMRNFVMLNDCLDIIESKLNSLKTSDLQLKLYLYSLLSLKLDLLKLVK